MALTEEQKAVFWENGFLPVHDVLNAEEVEALRKRTEQIILGEVAFPKEYLQIEPELAGRNPEEVPAIFRVRKLWNLTTHDPVFQEYARHPKIVEIVCDLLGPDVKLYADQMLLKPPFH